MRHVTLKSPRSNKTACLYEKHLERYLCLFRINLLEKAKQAEDQININKHTSTVQNQRPSNSDRLIE